MFVYGKHWMQVEDVVSSSSVLIDQKVLVPVGLAERYISESVRKSPSAFLCQLWTKSALG